LSRVISLELQVVLQMGIISQGTALKYREG